jgi:hypothetical protein
MADQGSCSDYSSAMGGKSCYSSYFLSQLEADHESSDWLSFCGKQIVTILMVI